MSAPIELDRAALRAAPLPPLSAVMDKEGRGSVLVVGGGAETFGAVMLTGLAALRCGAGKVGVAAAARYAPQLSFFVPEARVITVAATEEGDLLPGAADGLSEVMARSDAVVVGPGMVDKAASGALAARLIADAEGPGFVLDAAAMTSIEPEAARALGGKLVLTPHAGEMAALSGMTKSNVLADPLGAARQIARDYAAAVVMKGADSFIVSPDGRAWVNRGGVVGLATSGSGDVLAGAIGGLLARGAPPVVAAIWGVHLHARAGERLTDSVGKVGFLARELLAEIPKALAEAQG